MLFGKKLNRIFASVYLKIVLWKYYSKNKKTIEIPQNQTFKLHVPNRKWYCW
jgi:hypothetical protein